MGRLTTLQNKLINDLEKKDIQHKVVKNVVNFILIPDDKYEIDDPLSIVVAFFEEEIRVVIGQLCNKLSRTNNIKMLNDLNQDKIYGKYTVNDSDNIEYGSFKNVVYSMSTKSIYSLIDKCLMELSEDYYRIVGKQKFGSDVFKYIKNRNGATIIDRAKFVKDCFAKSYYASEYFIEENKEKVIKTVNDDAAIVYKEINSGSGTKIEQKLDSYCAENDISDKDKNTLLLAIKYTEIVKKYPFIKTIEASDCKIGLDDSYKKFILEVEKFYELVGVSAKNNLPLSLNFFQIPLFVP